MSVTSLRKKKIIQAHSMQKCRHQKQSNGLQNTKWEESYLLFFMPGRGTLQHVCRKCCQMLRSIAKRGVEQRGTVRDSIFQLTRSSAQTPSWHFKEDSVSTVSTKVLPEFLIVHTVKKNTGRWATLCCYDQRSATCYLSIHREQSLPPQELYLTRFWPYLRGTEWNK